MRSEFDNATHIFASNKHNSNIFHSAEYGAFRERIVSNFIKLLLPKQFELGNGFIITPLGDTSTQCDVIIYDKSNSSVFTESSHARLFPIESVIAVIEVKSDLTLAQLNKALEKLSEIKLLRTKMAPKTAIRGTNNQFFEDLDICNYIPTFIICKKLKFNIEKNINKIYLPENPFLNHNAILSLDDGIITFSDSSSKHYPFYIVKDPVIFAKDNRANDPNFITMLQNLPDLALRFNSKNHIYHFISLLLLTTSKTSVFDFDIVPYLYDN